MLIGAGVFGDGTGMQPRLMRKGRRPDETRLFHRHAVEDLIQHPAGAREPAQRLGAHPDLIAAGIGLFQQQDRDQGGKIGVATTLPQPVERALDLPRARVDGGQRAGDGVFGVVVGVNAQMIPRDACRDHGAGDAANLIGQRATIGVAKHDPTRARVIGYADRFQRVVWIGLVTVKEMLGVEERLAPLGDKMGDGFGDVVGVLGQRDAEGGFDVEVMGLADDADGFGARVEHGGQHVVILSRHARAFGHAKGGEPCLRRRRGVEKSAVGRVGAGPAAFDVIHAKRVERAGDLAFLIGGELHALGLLPVTQGGVVEGEARAGHGRLPPSASHSRSCPRHEQRPTAPMGGRFASARGRTPFLGRRHITTTPPTGSDQSPAAASALPHPCSSAPRSRPRSALS